jgi:RNA polymerase sigma-70 factor (ECF subfamily)
MPRDSRRDGSTRLFRARALLREALVRDMDMATVDVFSFGGERCDRIVAKALKRLEAEPGASAGTRPDPP